MTVTGLAGSGRSYLIDAIRKLLQHKCIVCSYFSTAAFNVKRRTLHSFLQLPIQGKRSSELKGQVLSRLQEEMTDISYLIIFEYSFIRQKLFGWISRRCKQPTGQSCVSFDEILVILVGDVAQLPPVIDKILYHNKPAGDLGIKGFCMYHKVDTVIKLHVNERAAGSSNEQTAFRDLQMNARDGTSTINDWKLLLTRTPDAASDATSFLKSAVKLSFGNDKLAKDNHSCLIKLGHPIAAVNTKYNNAIASKLSADDMWGLDPHLLLSKMPLLCSQKIYG